MKKIGRENLIKGADSFIEEAESHRYEIIEVESGYIYHSHVFNTSTFVPFKQDPIVTPDATLLALKGIVSTWNPEALDAQEMLFQINQLISAQ